MRSRVTNTSIEREYASLADIPTSGSSPDPAVIPPQTLLPDLVGTVVCTNQLMPVVTLPDGYGLLPLTLSISQVIAWTGLKKIKVQALINACAIASSKVDGRTLILTSSVIALIERNRVVRDC